MAVAITCRHTTWKKPKNPDNQDLCKSWRLAEKHHSAKQSFHWTVFILEIKMTVKPSVWILKIFSNVIYFISQLKKGGEIHLPHTTTANVLVQARELMITALSSFILWAFGLP